MFALFQFGTIAKQASCQLDCSFITVTITASCQSNPCILSGWLLIYHDVFFLSNASCQDGCSCILPGWLSMQPARMVVHATCQDGCPCILPGWLLVSHCALPLCNRQARRDKRLAPVYYAICPFSLSSSEPVYICHQKSFSW